VASLGGRSIFTPERAEAPRTYSDGSPAYAIRDAGWAGANDAFQSDMDVTDHQTAIIQYGNGVRLSFHDHRPEHANALADVPGLAATYPEVAAMLLARPEVETHVFRIILAETIDALPDYVRWLAAHNRTGRPIDLTLGTLLVGFPVYSLGGGLGIGGIQLSANVPVDPLLVGFTAYIQSAHQALGPVGPGFLGNPICFRIS
jgi:hypothetical protein